MNSSSIKRVVIATFVVATFSHAGARAQVISPKGSAGYTVSTLVADGLLRSPYSVEVDKNGNVYVADTGNYVVHEFNSTGHGSVIAGMTGNNQKNEISQVAPSARTAGVCYTQTGDHCLATQAVLSGPRDIAIDQNGNIYISDISAGKIRRINATTGVMSTYAGAKGGGWSDTQLHAPSGIAIDANGNLYVADKVNNAVRKIASPVGDAKQATITTIAGLGPDQPGCSIDGAVAATSMLNHPQDVAVDSAGNIYVADNGCRKVRKITTDGKITTIAGTGAGDVGDPPQVPFTAASGAALSINLSEPRAIAIDKKGNLLISDAGFDVVWFYKASKGTLEVFAGLTPTSSVCSKNTNPQGDGCHGDGAFLNVPGKPAIDAGGNIYIPEVGGTKSPMHPFDVRVLKPLSQ